MNKKVIWIGIASALLIGGGVFWFMKSKKDKQAAEEEAKRKEEEAKLEEEKAKAQQSQATQQVKQTVSLPPTPFKDQKEGDAFRAWVNKNKPDWRYNGDTLSPTGKIDNSTIRAAYKEFGESYQAEIKKLASQVSESKLAKEKELKQRQDTQRGFKNRENFGKTLFNEGVSGKKVRPLRGIESLYDTYYYDSGRKTYTKDGGKVKIGNNHLFSDWKIAGYNSFGYMWLQSKFNDKKSFVLANPYDFEAV